MKRKSMVLEDNFISLESYRDHIIDADAIVLHILTYMLHFPYGTIDLRSVYEYPLECNFSSKRVGSGRPHMRELSVKEYFTQTRIGKAYKNPKRSCFLKQEENSTQKKKYNWFDRTNICTQEVPSLEEVYNCLTIAKLKALDD
eukprot:TRINITY_DN3944_c0_g4_i1.p1 TRINITY_DN3944_c0_g4~~TRINITY_DN3944_c0_g4_i1.p1  ORF type:complete len:143 (+),score=14.13 TRINITY_DN3944_c0_g4_i1:212-640(+)